MHQHHHQGAMAGLGLAENGRPIASCCASAFSAAFVQIMKIIGLTLPLLA
jgi:hypothetical protein